MSNNDKDINSDSAIFARPKWSSILVPVLMVIAYNAPKSGTFGAGVVACVICFGLWVLFAAWERSGFETP